jgi:hypothetical protein
MYGAEALSTVVVLSFSNLLSACLLIILQDFLMKVFPTKASMPDVLFYDNNCSLYNFIANRRDIEEHFSRTALVVDVFHHRKHHDANDTTCQLHCNPTAFPQLYDEETRKWTFNSSACEQTNAWVNNFHGMVREMLPVRYEFFLDEVIKERNRWLVKELEKKGQRPHVIPAEALLDED